MEQRNVPYALLDRRIAGVDANFVGIDDLLAGKAIPAGRPLRKLTQIAEDAGSGCETERFECDQPQADRE